MLTKLLLHHKASLSLCYRINLSKKSKLVYVLCTNLVRRTLSKKHTCQVSDHSSEPVLQEVAQKLKKQSRDKAV